MSSNGSSSNHHGRGKQAASRRGAGRGAHSLASNENLRPVDVDALVGGAAGVNAVGSAGAGTTGTADAGKRVSNNAPSGQKADSEVHETPEDTPSNAPGGQKPDSVAPETPEGAPNNISDGQKSLLVAPEAADAASEVLPNPIFDHADGSEEAETPEVTATEPDFCPEGEEKPDADAPAHSELPGALEDYSRGSASYKHRKGRNFSSSQRVALIIVAVVAVLACVAGGIAFALWQNASENIQIQDEGLNDALTQVEETVDPFWTLVLGSDSRDEANDQARSDVILLARIDPSNKQITLVSIPRDTRVEIEGYGTDKINAAYSYGGASLAVSTVENYTGIKISHYVEIYFSGLEDLVDQLGGVTVDVPEYVNYSDVELYPGTQALTGHQALIFARNRKTYSEGDFTRTQCQRILASALIEKILSEPVTDIPGTIQSVSTCFSTDMSLTDIISMATSMQGITSENFYSAMAPSVADTVDGVSYTFTYINQWKLLMQRADAGEKPKLTKKEIEICGYDTTMYSTLDMSEGLPADVQEALQAYWDKKAAKAAKKAAAAEEESASQSASQDSAAS